MLLCLLIRVAQLKSAGVQQKYLNLAELHLSEAPNGGIFQSTGPSPSDGQPREVVSFYDLTDWPYLWPIGGWGGDLPLCFDFLRLLISGLGWEESSRRHMTRGETTRYAGRLASQSRATRFGTGCCICCYGYLSVFYCDALVFDNNQAVKVFPHFKF